MALSTRRAAFVPLEVICAHRPKETHRPKRLLLPNPPTLAPLSSPSPFVFVSRVHPSLPLVANDTLRAHLLPAAAAAGTTLTVLPRDATATPPPCRSGCAPCARAKARGWRQGLAPAKWWFSTREGRAVGHSSGGTPTAARLSGSSTLRGERLTTAGSPRSPGLSSPVPISSVSSSKLLVLLPWERRVTCTAILTAPRVLFPTGFDGVVF